MEQGRRPAGLAAALVRNFVSPMHGIFRLGRMRRCRSGAAAQDRGRAEKARRPTNLAATTGGGVGQGLYELM